MFNQLVLSVIDGRYFMIGLFLFISGNTIAQSPYFDFEEKDSLMDLYNGLENTSSQDSVLQLIEAWALSISDQSERIKVLEAKVTLLTAYNRHDHAFKEAYSIYERHCTPSAEEEVCLACSGIRDRLISFFAKIGRYRKSLNYALNKCDKDDMHDHYFKISGLYLNAGDLDSAFSSAEEFMNFAINSRNEIDVALAHNMNGFLHRSTGNYPEAKKEFLKAIYIGRSAGLTDKQLHLFIGNLGYTYKLNGELDSAMHYLELDANQSLVSGRMKSYALTEITIIQIELMQKNYSNTVNRLKSFMDSSINYLDIKKLIEMDSILQKTAVTSTDKDLLQIALRWSKYTTQKSQENDYLAREFDRELENQRIEQAYEKIILENKIAEQELKLLTTQKEQEDLRNLLIIITLLAGLIISLIVFWRYKSLQSKKSLINKMKVKMLAQEKEILVVQVKEEGENVQRLALELQSKQEFADNLIHRLKEREKIPKQDLQWIKQYINNELEVKSARIKIEEALADTSKMFYSKFKSIHPDISEADLKLCAQILLKLSNKEIGITKNIEITSVKKSKTRLKKKLGLNPDEDLSAYVESFL